MRLIELITNVDVENLSYFNPFKTNVPHHIESRPVSIWWGALVINGLNEEGFRKQEHAWNLETNFAERLSTCTKFQEWVVKKCS